MTARAEHAINECVLLEQEDLNAKAQKTLAGLFADGGDHGGFQSDGQ